MANRAHSANSAASGARLLAWAAEMEDAAARRYQRYAGRMAALDRPDLARLFTDLAAEEARHAQTLKARGAGPSGGDPPFAAADLPPVTAWTDLTDAELAQATPYRVLAEAVRAETGAFAWFSAIAGHAIDPELQELAEDLAREELGHATALRQARRRAYHAQSAVAERWPDPRKLRDPAELMRAARRREVALATDLTQAAALDANFQAAADQSRHLLALLMAGPPGKPGTGPATPSEPATDLMTRADAAFDFYDAVTVVARDEAVLEIAQRLTAAALERLRLLDRGLNG